MATKNLEVPKRALAIGAHPDDIEFGCGGTLAKWSAAGCEVFLLICTDGSKGTWEERTDTLQLVSTRQQEQRRAALQLGAKSEVIFLGWPDGELELGLTQRHEIAHWIRHVAPDVIFGHDPWKRYRLHPDHRAAGYLTTDGIVAARDPLFFPDLNLTPHRPSTLLLFEPDEVDHTEDVSFSFDQKLASLLEHQSQFRSTMAIDAANSPEGQITTEIDGFASRLRAELQENADGEEFELAEVFKRIDEL